MSAIVFEHVQFARGPQLILEDVSFAIESGEAVALVGRSGAGKTTALKLMNRLLEPQSGNILVRGTDTRAWDPFELRRQTGYVLQEIALFPHMTVGENVGVVPRLLGWSEPRIAARTRELLDLVDLPAATFGLRAPAALSGGQRQRVGVARALAADPPVAAHGRALRRPRSDHPARVARELSRDSAAAQENGRHRHPRYE